MTTIQSWLASATQQLHAAHIESDRLDALILLEDELHTNRTHILAELGSNLRNEQQDNLDKLLQRRLKHEPLAYIRGKSEFYGREFIISPAVLVPRPESEAMIELLITSLPAIDNPSIADIGTGSGALGITAALELPQTQVDLFEIDDKAIELAQMNVISLTTGLNVLQSDLLQSATKDYDVLLCNLPYVPDNYAINRAATYEPKLALYSGKDGLDLYRKLFEQIQLLAKRPLLILTESLLAQHMSLKQIASNNGYQEVNNHDLIQVFAPTL